MVHPASAPSEAASTTPAVLAGVACVSSSLLMTELALTRIFSVTMYYHFAFLAISIALFGLSASGVYVFLARRRLGARAGPHAPRVARARLRGGHHGRAGLAGPDPRRPQLLASEPAR